MGRRPKPKQDLVKSLSSSGYSPAVQKHLDDLMELALEKAKAVIANKIGDMDDLTLVQVLKEVRQLIRDTKGPNTSITAIQVPASPQLEKQDSRFKSINASADSEDPKELERLRKSQENFLGKEE